MSLTVSAIELKLFLILNPPLEFYFLTYLYHRVNSLGKERGDERLFQNFVQ